MANSRLGADSAHDNRYHTFRQAVLAPLADSAEQVNDPTFHHAMQHDAEVRWQEGMLRVHMTDHMRQAENYRRLILWREERHSVITADSPCAIVERQHWREVDRQMRIPAPHRRAIDWKRKVLPYLGGHPDWLALILADEARLPARPAPRGRASK